MEFEKNAVRVEREDGTRVAVTCGHPACTQLVWPDDYPTDQELYLVPVTTFGGTCEACGEKLLK